ncbi:acylphosphatase [Lachnobacterium bovis]|uniref:acylphosphatase n=1 Tax=Lachnobacterium bovis TaxID=140626 RepID=UPI0003B5F9DD|nr:acylphosphatase [Lachnobacterium bovis]
MIRRYYKVYGEVQAVGFRHFSKVVADKHNLTGYVQNEYDGSVTIEVQGEEEVVRNFLDEIEKVSYHVGISRYTWENLAICPQETEFSIL